MPDTNLQSLAKQVASCERYGFNGSCAVVLILVTSVYPLEVDVVRLAQYLVFPELAGLLRVPTAEGTQPLRHSGVNG